MKHRTTKRLALLLAGLLLLGLFAGCSAKYDASADDSAYYQTSGSNSNNAPAMSESASDLKDMPMEEPEGGFYTDNGSFDADMPTSAAGGSQADNSLSAAQDPSAYAEKIIYSADMVIESTEFDKAISTVESMISQFDGFIESSNTWGNTQYQADGTTKIVDRHAQYTIRVPQPRFEEFLHQSGSIGNVTDTSRYAENITSQYTDQEARMASLQTQEERLLDMLSKATEVDSLIMLESRLSEVRYEIESIERTLRNWQMRVNYSTVNLSVHEVELYTPTAAVNRSFGEKLSSALSDGWSGFVLNVQYFILGTLRNLPALLIFAAVVVVAVLLVRGFCRRRKARRNPPADSISNENPSDEETSS